MPARRLARRARPTTPARRGALWGLPTGRCRRLPEREPLPDIQCVKSNRVALEVPRVRKSPGGSGWPESLLQTLAAGRKAICGWDIKQLGPSNSDQAECRVPLKAAALDGDV
eukprot:gene15376-biopygen8162